MRAGALRDCFGRAHATRANGGSSSLDVHRVFASRCAQPSVVDLLSTAGGLVFGGTEEGNFIALDAETGKTRAWLESQCAAKK